MRNTALVLIALATTLGVAAQQDPTLPNTAVASTAVSGASSLPTGRIGNNDLLGITVYDGPPLSGPVRVSPQGNIRLPMVEQPIHAAGLNPYQLEQVIAADLIKDHLFLKPIVTVTITEYESRPITVVGAVGSPITFQAMGPVTLLDAISRAGGITKNAGSEILISSQAPGTNGKEASLTQRVPVQGLLDSANPALNIELHGGDVVRVPEAGQLFIVGDVKSPGSYSITNGSHSSILKALALSGGLGRRPGHVAYIYRREGGAKGRNEIPVQLKKIMNRKSPDVALNANDILYIPGAKGPFLSPTMLATLVEVGTSVGLTLLYIYQ